ncbi:MAG: hypothetical protein LBU23_06885 [Planctomycetota bacterium]|nr:hypothetical protein [Planctomycetota bacterium]
MKHDCVLAVDIGSSNIKAMVFSSRGDMVGSASEEVGEMYTGPARAEHSPEQLWEKFRLAVGAAVRDSGVAPGEIAAICLDSNRSGFILLDKDRLPLTNNMSWRDGRSVRQVKRFKEANRDIDTYRISGEDGLPQHTLYKILWLKEEHPDIWRQGRYICLSPKDYVLLRMLNRRITSTSIAQSSGLFDINSLRYSEAILDRAGIDADMLPELSDTDSRIGELDRGMAAKLGLAEGTPVICGLCDATASQVGTGSTRPGDFAVSIGTCGAVRTFIAAPRFEADRSTQVRVVSPFGYVASCTISDAGGVLKWFRDRFCGRERDLAREEGVDAYAVIDREAAKIPPGSDGLLLLPCFTGASYAFKDPNVFGAFVGIRNAHALPHFGRAIMEGVAMSLRVVLDKFRANGFAVSRITLGGGGARSALWTRILADVLDLPLAIPACGESSCLGAAVIAALGLGWFGGFDEAVRAMCKIRATIEPARANAEVYRRHFELFSRLYRVFEEAGYFAAHGEITAVDARIPGKET